MMKLIYGLMDTFWYTTIQLVLSIEMTYEMVGIFSILEIIIFISKLINDVTFSNGLTLILCNDWFLQKKRT